MSQITEIKINGISVSLDQIEYNVFVNHGRSSITDGATASSATLTMIAQNVSLPDVKVAYSLNIKAYGIDRFTGRITDLQIVHLKDGFALISIQGMGKVSRIFNKYIDSYSFPKQSAHARVLEILEQTYEDYNVDGGLDVELKAKTVDYASISDLLQKVATDVGAAIVDTPDGKILFQFYDIRGSDSLFEQWQNQGSLKWTGYGLERWVDQIETSPTAGIPLDLDADSVIFEPIWRTQSGNIINRAIIEYDNGSFYMAENTDSQTDFGLRTLSLNTEIYNSASAITRAGEIITRQAFPRWSLGSVEIYMERVTNTTQRDAIMNLYCGKRVQINGLPNPAPYATWVGVTEGWSESFTGLGNDLGTHRITLALSDPLQSYAAMSWETLTTQKWNTIDTAVIWADAIVPADLVP